MPEQTAPAQMCQLERQAAATSHVEEPVTVVDAQLVVNHHVLPAARWLCQRRQVGCPPAPSFVHDSPRRPWRNALPHPNCPPGVTIHERLPTGADHICQVFGVLDGPQPTYIIRRAGCATFYSVARLGPSRSVRGFRTGRSQGDADGGLVQPHPRLSASVVSKSVSKISSQAVHGVACAVADGASANLI